MKEAVIQEPKPAKSTKSVTSCYHCGETCDQSILSDQKYFCCEGCKFVYQLLQENGLCNYYELSEKPGIKVKGRFSNQRFAYLDNPDIKQKLLRFNDPKQQQALFYLPSMHCASCIWLLENLHSINPGILFSKTDFQRKEVFIAFEPDKLSLRQVVELLAFIGYEPYISLEEGEKKQAKKISRKKIYRIGVAGFCFGNIMMLSFPEYFSSGNIEQNNLEIVFSYLNLFLSLPVIFYSADEFFISAWKGIRQKWLNIDAPIALAIAVTFSRSVYEILSGTGPGYLDSMSGIVFFMLIGRWFQDMTYDSFSFDRDYKSYFPLGVTLLKNGKEETATIRALKKGDHILVRQSEMIPADGIISKGEGNIDYSFVSGENNPYLKRVGELVYAGGTQLGSSIEMEVVKPVEQSYITQLWNNEVFTNRKNKERSFIHPWSRYFTMVLFSITAIAALYWNINDPGKIWPAVTAALIVACPCSLLLSSTFTYGNMLRHFGKNGFYLKNASVVEVMGKINTIVFDKTGTLTHSNSTNIYNSVFLNEDEANMIYTVAKESTHPLSRGIRQYLLQTLNARPVAVSHFKETAGMGAEADINGKIVRIGSEKFISGKIQNEINEQTGKVYYSINGTKSGVFNIRNHYRDGIQQMADSLANGKNSIHVLTGDNTAERENLENIFGKNTIVRFRQSPQDKLEYIKQIKSENKDSKILMIGDGLNDAGALKQSDVGVAVSENTSRFTPACDAILHDKQVSKLNRFLDYARSGKKVITVSFILSIIYNIVGLSFALQGLLSPLVAAILMPVSSISIVSFVTLATSISARKKRLSE